VAFGWRRIWLYNWYVPRYKVSYGVDATDATDSDNTYIFAGGGIDLDGYVNFILSEGVPPEHIQIELLNEAKAPGATA